MKNSVSNALPPDDLASSSCGESGEGQQITGTRMIDEAVVGLCPQIVTMAETDRQRLGDLIESYLGSQQEILQRIEDVTNEDVSSFLTGAKTLAKRHTLGIIADLEVYLEGKATEAYSRSKM